MTQQPDPGWVQPPPQENNGSPPSQPQVVYQAQTTNGLAIASLVLGILWIWWIGSLLALIFGYQARSQIDRSGGTQSGRGLAVAGIVLGWVAFGTLLIPVTFWML